MSGANYYSALIGALAAIVTGFLMESYKRHKDRQGIASALLGEVRGIHRVFCQTMPNLEKMNLLLAAKAEFNFKTLKSKPASGEIIFNKCADKIGLLPDPIPELVATFYGNHSTIHMFSVDLFSGSYDDDEKERIRTMKFVENRMKEVITVGDSLIPSLQYVARTNWLAAMINLNKPKVQAIEGWQRLT